MVWSKTFYFLLFNSFKCIIFKMKMAKKENTKTIMEFTKKDLQTNMIMNVIDIIYKKNIVNKILNYFNYI